MLKVESICKKNGNFMLRDISFTLEPGYVLGLIGCNGAGKTTTLKAILNINKPDSGKAKLFGKDMLGKDASYKQEIGIVFGEFSYYGSKRIRNVTDTIKKFYDCWNGETYKKYMSYFGIDETKRVNELSTGMRIKYAITIALSHDAKLFIFDEPTSGLDPVSRHELLDIFREIVSDGEKSILFSTHITSDLDKCADYIVYIQNGGIILNADRETVLDSFKLVSGSARQLTDDIKSKLIGYETNAFGFTGMMTTESAMQCTELQIARPDIESIMVYSEKNNIERRN